MLRHWYYINGRLAKLEGTEAQITVTLKALANQGDTIAPARPPKAISPAQYASASAHIRR